MRKSKWTGYWEQPPFGRQPMNELELQVDGGQVKGSGWDIIGIFSFDGVYGSDGAIALIKQYLGSHQVLYRGQYDGEGTISGEWSIREGQRFRVLLIISIGSTVTLRHSTEQRCAAPSRCGFRAAAVRTLKSSCWNEPELGFNRNYCSYNYLLIRASLQRRSHSGLFLHSDRRDDRESSTNFATPWLLPGSTILPRESTKIQDG